MQVLKSVVLDLWQFVVTELGFRVSESSTPVQPVAPVSATASPLLLPGSDVALETASTAESVPGATTPAVAAAVSLDRQAYVRYPETPCYLRPGQALDTMIGTLPYGAAVTVVSRREGWLQIRNEAVEGWVEAVMLTPDEAAVFPSFVIEEQYDVDHPETLKLRTYINDEFGGGIARTALLSCEYVWYQLLRAGRDFSWPLSRPRTAGRWAEILQGAPTAHVGSVPLTGGVMEYLDEANQAQLFYVTAVRPDEAVVVSGILPTPAGTYSEQTVSRAEWHAFGARFINKK